MNNFFKVRKNWNTSENGKIRLNISRSVRGVLQEDSK
jgi:hypothetical protein